MAKKYTARCACGAVKFEFDTDPTFIAVCHEAARPAAIREHAGLKSMHSCKAIRDKAQHHGD